MKNHMRFIIILILSAICIQNLVAQESRPWFQNGPWRWPATNPKARLLPLIKVKGNKFVNPKGDTILFRGQLGTMTWSEWKTINENIINLIRSFDMETIPLVAGFDWAYDLSSLHDNPLNAEGIGYVTHPYENKRSQPWEPKWEENFGFAADKYPVVATEFGFGLRPGQTINANHYNNRIINYLEGKGISWLCWVYDPEWGPSMLKSWDTYELTESGAFFKKAMHGELNFQKN